MSLSNRGAPLVLPFTLAFLAAQLHVFTMIPSTDETLMRHWLAHYTGLGVRPSHIQVLVDPQRDPARGRALPGGGTTGRRRPGRLRAERQILRQVGRAVGEQADPTHDEERRHGVTTPGSGTRAVARIHQHHRPHLHPPWFDQRPKIPFRD